MVDMTLYIILTSEIRIFTDCQDFMKASGRMFGLSWRTIEIRRSFWHWTILIFCLHFPILPLPQCNFLAFGHSQSSISKWPLWSKWDMQSLQAIGLQQSYASSEVFSVSYSVVLCRVLDNCFMWHATCKLSGCLLSSPVFFSEKAVFSLVEVVVHMFTSLWQTGTMSLLSF